MKKADEQSGSLPKKSTSASSLREPVRGSNQNNEEREGITDRRKKFKFINKQVERINRVGSIKVQRINAVPNDDGMNSNGLTFGDVGVITILWTVEVVHIMISGFKDKYISENDISDVTEGAAETTLIMITLIVMMVVGACLTFWSFLNKFMFWIMLIGLSVYSFGAVIGVMLSITKSAATVVSMRSLDIFWYAVHPIRYWYIFHQQFPISIRMSHFLVSANILAIGVVEYIITGLVKNANHPFSETSSAIAFTIVVVVAIGWIFAVFIIKRFLNPVPGDLNSIREVYARTGYIEKFDKTQKYSGIFRFVALILPAFIFPAIFVYFDEGYILLLNNALAPNMGEMSLYRPDIIIALLTVIITEVVFQMMKRIRKGSTDEILITAAHLINIISIFWIIYILYRTVNIRHKFPGKNEAILLVMSNLDDHCFLQVGDDIIEWHQALTIVVVKNVFDRRTVRIRFVSPMFGDVVFESTIDVEESRKNSVNAFNLVRKGLKFELIKIPSFPPLRYWYKNTERVLLTNGLEECWDFNRTAYDELGFNENTTRGGLVRGFCNPVRLLVFEIKKGIGSAAVVKLPAHNESRYFVFPCDPMQPGDSDETRTCLVDGIELYLLLLKKYRRLNGLEERKVPTRDTIKVIRPHSFFLLREEEYYYNNPLRRETPNPTSSECLDYRSESELQLLGIMALSGIALGFASVGYIHILWTRSPVRFRILIIFSFFAALYAASSLTNNYLTKLNEDSVFLLLILSAICFLWNIAVLLLVWREHDRERRY